MDIKIQAWLLDIQVCIDEIYDFWAIAETLLLIKTT